MSVAVSQLTMDRNQSFMEKLIHSEQILSYIICTIALIEIAEPCTNIWQKRQETNSLREFLVLNLAEDTYIFMDDLDHIGILFSGHSTAVVENISNLLSQQSSYRVSIGIGKPFKNLEKLHHSYQQALKSLQHTFYEGKGHVIYYDNFGEYRSCGEYPYVIEKDLYDTIKSGNNSYEVKRGIEAFYAYLLQKGPLEVNEIYETSIRLLIEMEKRVFVEFGAEFKYHQFEIMSIVHMETIQEVIGYVHKDLIELGEKISNKFMYTHSNIINKMIQHMESECRNASLHSLAQKVFMSPSYLSLLFKLKTGKTFIDQLTDIRIIKAKQLLTNTHMKNYEVAEEVGYHDSRYFSQIFKKRVGLSPSEYRESIRK